MRQIIISGQRHEAEHSKAFSLGSVTSRMFPFTFLPTCGQRRGRKVRRRAGTVCNYAGAVHHRDGNRRIPNEDDKEQPGETVAKTGDKAEMLLWICLIAATSAIALKIKKIRHYSRMIE